ncbi:MAG: DUF3352 domain-containing protein [Acidimicrobiales bacterium]
MAGLVVVALLVALPACGGKTDEATRAAGITPPDALGLVSLNLDPSIEQKRNMLSVARRFPDARDEVKDEFESTKDELIKDLLEDSGLDYEKDVKPLLGNEVALVVLPPAAGSDGGPAFVAMVETDDEAEARAAIDKAAAAGDFDGAYAVVEDFVLLSDQDDEANDQAALDRVSAQARKGEDSLADSDRFNEVVDKLAGDRLVLIWADLAKALALIEEEGEDLPPFNLAESFENAETLAADLHVEDDAVVFQGVARSAGGGEGNVAELTKALPETTLAALTLFNVGDTLREGATAFLGGGDGPEFLAEVEREIGVDFDSDLFSWIGGELVFVAGDVPEGQSFPNFALVVEPTDQSKAEAGVAKIRQALEAQGFALEERQVAGASALVAAEPITEGIQPAMALFEDRFVLASSPAYLEELAKADSPGLAGTDAYESVLEDDEDVIMQFVVLIDPVRMALEEAFLTDTEDQREYESEVKPNVEPLSAFGIVAHRDGDFARLTFKLTFD